MTKNTIGFIGDVHGDMVAYKAAIGSLLAQGATETIQVGDMGAGFIPHVPIINGSRFIRGNHDCPEYCFGHPSWIVDGEYDKRIKAFFVGGAYSVDKELRTPGVDWWDNEQVTQRQANVILRKYPKLKAEIVVTHDFPSSVTAQMFGYKQVHQNTTNLLLDEMLRIHRPKLWVGGHHHVDVDQTIDGTRFVCIKTNGTFLYQP